jgi:phosphoglycolate phosphatase
MKLAIFDVDGTLMDSQGQILAAMAGAYAALGLRLPPRAEILAIVGLSLPQAFEQLEPGADDATNAALVAAYKASFHAGFSLPPLFDGARAALDSLSVRPDVVMGVATGKSRRGLDKVLEGHGLSGRFVTAQVSDDHPSKPHPSMVQRAMAEAGTTRAVMIGDTRFDMDMGRAAGVRTLGVSWGYHPRAALRGADLVIDSFADLLPALDELWGPT